MDLIKVFGYRHARRALLETSNSAFRNLLFPSQVALRQIPAKRGMRYSSPRATLT